MILMFLTNRFSFVESVLFTFSKLFSLPLKANVKMIKYEELKDDYLESLVTFLHSVKWVFNVLNTQYIIEDVISENKEFLETLNQIDLSDFPDLNTPQDNHPECLQKLVKQVNEFKISFDTLTSIEWKPTPGKRMSIKKQYEIENVSKVIRTVCQEEVTQLVDFGSGLGYLGHHLFEEYQYSVLGLEGCDDRVQNANERQKKYHPKSCFKVRHMKHFIGLDSEDFILSQFEDDSTPIAFFGLHGCGDLTVTAIKLFLSMKRVTKLMFMPCCYHKMSPSELESNEFNFFPLSDKLKSIVTSFPPFLNRSFLRLAGQQSPGKWKEMSDEDHWIHGKNMFERALVEALLTEDETIKRIKNVSFPENRVTMNDVKIKYQLYEKSSGNEKAWTSSHHQKFNEWRSKLHDGEEMSENLFCLQTTIQNVCEMLVLIDRVKFIEEVAERMDSKMKVSVVKLQNDKLTPRCLILNVAKL